MTESVTFTVPDNVTRLRARIEAYDRALAELLASRAEASMDVQVAKVVSGAPRVDLAREREVIATYVEVLGGAGLAVADAVLAYCRGKVL